LAERRVDIVVVGGGVAGLVAMRALSTRGLSCALLEAGDRWGGVVRTVRPSGFVLDAGADSILAQKPEGVALCAELGLADQLIPTNASQRTVYVLFRDRLHPMPEGMVLGIPTRPWSLLYSGLFSWRGKLRMAMEPFVRKRRGGGEESIADFIRRRLGPEALTLMGEPLLGGIHAGDPEQLSITATFPRLPEMEKRYGSLVLGMRAAVASAGATRGSAAFLALKGGMGDLVDALVARLPAETRHLRTPAVRLLRDGAGFVVMAPDAAWRSRAVMLATPAHATAPLVAPLSSDLATGLASIRFASTATVLLGFRRSDVGHPLDGYGLVVPRAAGKHTLACTFVSTKLPGRAPDGHVALRGFLGGMRDPAVLEQDDAGLTACVLEEISSVLDLRGAPVLTEVSRYPLGTPQMEVGHAERMMVVDRALAFQAGLFLTGAGLRGTGLPDVIADATRVAASAAAYLGGP
jgi:protoporphyrinogen/coproporphyrinogen III oxidase